MSNGQWAALAAFVLLAIAAVVMVILPHLS